MHKYLILIMVFAFSCLTPALADTITLRADSWCPINCEPGSDRPGYLIEIAKSVFEPAGHTIDYKTLNWARAIADTRTGQFNAIVGATESDAPDFVFPQNPLGSSRSCFYTKSSNPWSYSGVDSLKKIKLGVTKDYAYGEPLDGYIKANPALIDLASGDEVLDRQVKMLMADRIGALIDDANVAGYYISTNKLGGSIKEVGCLEQTGLSIAFSPANPKSKDYAQMLSAGIETLRSSGKLKVILDKYGLKDWN